MNLTLTPEDVNHFLAVSREIDQLGGVCFRHLPENVVNLFVLSGKYNVSSNVGYYDIEKITG